MRIVLAIALCIVLGIALFIVLGIALFIVLGIALFIVLGIALFIVLGTALIVSELHLTRLCRTEPVAPALPCADLVGAASRRRVLKLCGWQPFNPSQ
jgi:hypothetical protein